jgi:hypothetical protein
VAAADAVCAGVWQDWLGHLAVPDLGWYPVGPDQRPAAVTAAGDDTRRTRQAPVETQGMRADTTQEKEFPQVGKKGSMHF